MGYHSREPPDIGKNAINQPPTGFIQVCTPMGSEEARILVMKGADVTRVGWPETRAQSLWNKVTRSWYHNINSSYIYHLKTPRRQGQRGQNIGAVRSFALTIRSAFCKTRSQNISFCNRTDELSGMWLKTIYITHIPRPASRVHVYIQVEPPVSLLKMLFYAKKRFSSNTSRLNA